MPTPSIQNNPLIGIWKLISATAIQADGTINSAVYGTHPVGYITYTSDGHMMVMFSKSDRAPLSQEVQSPLSPQMQSLSPSPKKGEGERDSCSPLPERERGWGWGISCYSTTLSALSWHQCTVPNKFHSSTTYWLIVPHLLLIHIRTLWIKI